MKESAFNNTVLEGKERRYTIINERDVNKYLSEIDKIKLNAVLDKYLEMIEDARIDDDKKPYNSYIVINTDESYVEDIVKIMKDNGHFK